MKAESFAIETKSSDIEASLRPLLAHDDLMRHFETIQLELVLGLRPLADQLRADALPRARRRVAELPSAEKLDGWYRVLRKALDAQPDSREAHVLIELMMSAMRGKPAVPLVIQSFVFAVMEARMSPHIIAGAVSRVWTACGTKPTLQAFLRICTSHRDGTQVAIDQVVRTMGLRKDAEKTVARSEGRI